MYGYENFEPTTITTSFDGAINQIDVDLERKIKEYLAFRCGMREVFTYPWMSDEYINAILQSTDGLLALATPPSPTEKYIRSSLLPNLCKAVTGNQRYFDEFAIFETAQILQDRGYEARYDARESLPLQRRYVSGAFVGDSENVDVLFRKAKGVIESMPRFTHMEAFTFEKREKPVWADNVVWLNVLFAGEPVGNLALLSKKAALACSIKNSAVMLFELDIDALKPYPSRTNLFTHLPEYPLNDYDISLLFDSSVQWESIAAVVMGKRGPDDLLRQVVFVDEYKGAQIPDGKKSVTMRFVIGSLKKTLTSSEIESTANAAVKRLEKQLGAGLRG